MVVAGTNSDFSRLKYPQTLPVQAPHICLWEIPQLYAPYMVPLRNFEERLVELVAALLEQLSKWMLMSLVSRA
jgi:hypothetical protein